MSELSGKIALVTGGSRGIGAATARRLGALGLRVVVSGRDRGALEAVAREVSGQAVEADLGEVGGVERLLGEVRRKVGEVDVLVANAGVDAPYTYRATTDAIWEQVMRVNATSVFQLCRGLIPAMVERGWGRVVVVASTAGLAGYAYSAAYCASKHAVVGLVRALAAELARAPVTINAVCPGFVDTAMAGRAVKNIAEKTRRTEEEARAALERMSPQQRLMTPEEVAHVVAMLLPHEARGIHGQAIAINGGAFGA
ncbi:MAG: SDR family NAD(P)-dependent oxidoreductase [Myxococcales bacterium]|nr:SDR family oxidoreductase [Polyangiaceae bacterium]MDW8247924.1 SDR family NAD(P)-dependent oxidoreductase [Myxococcales bacterium]